MADIRGHNHNDLLKIIVDGFFIDMKRFLTTEVWQESNQKYVYILSVAN